MRVVAKCCIQDDLERSVLAPEVARLDATPYQIADASIHWEFHEFVVKRSPVANGSHHDGVDRDHDVPCQSDVLGQLLKCISKSQKSREIRIRYVDRKGVRRATAHDRGTLEDVPGTKVPCEKELLVHDGAWCRPDGSGVPRFKVVVPRGQVDVVVVIVRLGFLPCLEPKGCEIEVLDLDAHRELIVFTTMWIAVWWCEGQSVVP